MGKSDPEGVSKYERPEVEVERAEMRDANAEQRNVNGVPASEGDTSTTWQIDAHRSGSQGA